MEAMLESDDAHCTELVTSALEPFEYFAVAVNCCVDPIPIDIEPGATCNDDREGEEVCEVECDPEPPQPQFSDAKIISTREARIFFINPPSPSGFATRALRLATALWYMPLQALGQSHNCRNGPREHRKSFALYKFRMRHVSATDGTSGEFVFATDEICQTKIGNNWGLGPPQIRPNRYVTPTATSGVRFRRD